MKTLFTLLAAVLLAGCGTFTVKPGADPVVVYAEATSESALDTFDSFLKWERNNEAALQKVNPKIHQTADEIRDHGIEWIQELRKATQVYKANRTDPNRAALKIAQEFLDYGLTEARTRMMEGGK